MNEGGESAFFRYAKYSAVAFEFIASIVAGVFIGNALDAWFRTQPWMVLAMTIAGTVIGFYRMIQTLQHLQNLK